MNGVDGTVNNPGNLLLGEFFSKRYDGFAIAGGSIKNKDVLAPNTGSGYALIQFGHSPSSFVDIIFTIYGTTKSMSGVLQPDGWLMIRPAETLAENTFLNFNVSYPCK